MAAARIVEVADVADAVAIFLVPEGSGRRFHLESPLKVRQRSGFPGRDGKHTPTPISCQVYQSVVFEGFLAVFQPHFMLE